MAPRRGRARRWATALRQRSAAAMPHCDGDAAMVLWVEVARARTKNALQCSSCCAEEAALTFRMAAQALAPSYFRLSDDGLSARAPETR